MNRSSRQRGKEGGFGRDAPARPHGGPRGMLQYFILHRISSKPSHGYEILQDIESKTEGSWRPGAGSIYPILKKLLAQGLIKVDPSGSREARRTYHVTPKGIERLKETREMFANVGQRWSAMRGLFIDLIEPEYVERFFIDGSKKQFQFTQEILKSKMDRLPQTELEYILKEYRLSLERQLDWTNQTLSRLNKPVQANVP